MKQRMRDSAPFSLSTISVGAPMKLTVNTFTNFRVYTIVRGTETIGSCAIYCLLASIIGQGGGLIRACIKDVTSTFDDTNPHTNVPPYATHGHGHRQASSDMVVPHAISRAVAHAIRGAGFAGQRALSAAGPGPAGGAADRDTPDAKCAKSAGSSLIKVLTANHVCVDPIRHFAGGTLCRQTVTQ